MAIESEADDLFYGGAAGGGKSDLLLGLSINEHEKSIIFRREFPQLRDLIERGEEILGRHGEMNWGSQRLRFKGGTIEFGSCPIDKDKKKWKGRPHDLKCFDEISDFSREVFVYLKTWERTTTHGQRTRTVAAGNPPESTEGAWVIDYWGPWLDPLHDDKAEPGELRWYVSTKDGKTDIAVPDSKPIMLEGERVYPRSRTFIPALLSDNPYLSTDNDYLRVVQSLPEPLRSQLLNGDFGAVAGDDQWQVIPSEWYDLAVLRWKHMEEAVPPMTALGIDVARGGRDRTTFAPKHGYWFGELDTRPGKECKSGREVCGEAIKLTSGVEGGVKMGIDVIGVGASPFDLLEDAGAIISGINFGAGSDDTDKSGRYKMLNVRAAAYWGFREALDPEYSRIALPPDPQLRGELLVPRWKVMSGRIQIEAKDDIKARLGRSPDLADAVVLAWYVDRRKKIEFW